MSLSTRRALALVLPAALAVLALLASTASAQLSAQPDAQDFGIVSVEQGEQSVPIAVTNSGAGSTQLGSATLDGPGADNFRIDNDGCNGQLLAPGQGCTVQVGFDPGDEVDYAATLRLHSDDGDFAVPLTGIGGVQRAVPSPALLDFGDIGLGGGATRSITVANTGNLPYQTIVAIPNGGDVGAFRVVRDGCSLQLIEPGGDCVLDVRFSPLAAGRVEATLTLITGNSSPLLVALRGSGRQAAAVIAPASADFGAQLVGVASAARAFTVVNAGDGALRVATLGIAGADAEQFRLAGEDCTASPLPPAGACTVRVRFAPGAAGAFGASLRLAADGADGVATTPLAGRGVGAASPARISFDRREGAPAPFAHGRIALGVARCTPAAARCRVTVRARVYTVLARGARVRGRSGRIHWRPGTGMHVSLPLPARLHGSPALLVARLRTTAAGRPSTTRTLVMPLVPARR